MWMIRKRKWAISKTNQRLRYAPAEGMLSRFPFCLRARTAIFLALIAGNGIISRHGQAQAKPADNEKMAAQASSSQAIAFSFPEEAHVEKQLDLSCGREGLEIIKDYSGKPDAFGVFEIYDLKVPAFQKATYYHSRFWPMGANQMFPTITTTADGPEGGFYLLLKIADNDFLAVLPLCGEHAFAWFSPKDAKYRLKMGHLGTAALKDQDIPLVSWARAANPYQASWIAWKAASQCEQIKGNLVLRKDKKFPEPLEYLGWCSWNAFGSRIDESNMIAVIQALKTAPVPVRWMLMDEGHSDRISVAPNRKFPHGYGPLTHLRDGKIKWMGNWYAFFGDVNGMRTANSRFEPIQRDVFDWNGRVLPQDDLKSARAFFEYIFRASDPKGPAGMEGFDFLKVDFQTQVASCLAGDLRKPRDATVMPNPIATGATYVRAFQDVMANRFSGGLINCNWHNAICIFNSRQMATGRCSEDYHPGNVTNYVNNLWHSYASTPWLGQIAWGDHDMLHSKDPMGGAIMAASKAVAGAASYLGDKPAELVSEVILPLCDADGCMIRPLAPAAPLPEDIFEPANAPGRLFRIVAPLKHRSATFIFYNFLTEAHKPVALTSIITAKDYTHASGMIQPYPGDWPVPREGLVVYDWRNGTARELGAGYPVSITGLKDAVLQLSPIQQGWSVIGRTDKYLAAATVDEIRADNNQLRLKIHEQGPLAIWLREGHPEADGVSFKPKGGGLFEADMPVARQSMEIIIRRKL
jgi:hypothetical protein